jgi:hypothetical protein
MPNISQSWNRKCVPKLEPGNEMQELGNEMKAGAWELDDLPALKIILSNSDCKG